MVTVARRVREIGIRMALGASVGEVGRGVLGRGLRLALWGIALGTAVSIAGTRLLTGFLYGVEPRDPVTMVGVPIVLTLCGGAGQRHPRLASDPGRPDRGAEGRLER